MEIQYDFQKLRSIRKRSFTLKEVEDGTGITESYLSKIEQGKVNNLRKKTMERLTKFLGISMQEIQMNSSNTELFPQVEREGAGVSFTNATEKLQFETESSAEIREKYFAGLYSELTLAQMINRRRKELGYDRNTLESKLRFRKSIYSGIISETKRYIPLSVIQNLSEALQMPVEHLMKAKGVIIVPENHLKDSENNAKLSKTKIAISAAAKTERLDIEQTIQQQVRMQVAELFEREKEFIIDTISNNLFTKYKEQLKSSIVITALEAPNKRKKLNRLK
jgi:transcriptional regulator with XRE-family HTH domain